MALLLPLVIATYVPPLFHSNLLSATDILPVSLIRKDKLVMMERLSQRTPREIHGRGFQIRGPFIHLSVLMKFHLRQYCKFSSKTFRNHPPFHPFHFVEKNQQPKSKQRPGKQTPDNQVKNSVGKSHALRISLRRQAFLVSVLFLLPRVDGGRKYRAEVAYNPSSEESEMKWTGTQLSMKSSSYHQPLKGLFQLMRKK